MKPLNREIVRGRKVEEYFLGGKFYTYVNDRRVVTSFQETCHILETGEKVKYAPSKIKP